MRPFLTLHNPESARAFYRAGLWRSDTFYSLLRGHAQTRPDAYAARDGSKRLSWRELISWVDGAASAFRQEGLVGGDRVSLWLSNKLEAVVTFLACSREGLACNPSLHQTYTRSQIVPLMNGLSSRVLLTQSNWGADRAPLDREFYHTEVASLKRVYGLDDFPRASVNDKEPSSDPDKVLYLAFTSGTTGMPKCVMHSDNSLLANSRDLVRDWGISSDTRLLTLSPLSHHIAWVAVAQWLLSGCELITDDPPAEMGRVDWIAETSATYVMGVPTHAIDLLAEQRKRGMERIGLVEIFYMAGAPIPPSVADAFIRQGIKPQNVYGMTENSSHQYTHPDDDRDTTIATCGRGGAAYEVRIFDPADQDRELPVGAEGHIGGRGASLMLGYFNNQIATEDSFNRDGWFMSGDLGVLDARGNLTIRGRLKDIIIRGGHNIYPSQIEALAHRHADVQKAAVFPVPDERLGERVCVAVIGVVTPDELLAHLLREGLSKYDMPEFFLRMTAFPLTASGKILKRELVAMVGRKELIPERVSYRQLKEPA